MKQWSWLLLGVLLGGESLCAAITVTDQKGRSMEVDVLEYKPVTKMTKIKRTDGQVFNVNIGVFDEASRKRIVENAPESRRPSCWSGFPWASVASARGTAVS